MLEKTNPTKPYGRLGGGRSAGATVPRRTRAVANSAQAPGGWLLPEPSSFSGAARIR